MSSRARNTRSYSRYSKVDRPQWKEGDETESGIDDEGVELKNWRSHPAIRVDNTTNKPYVICSHWAKNGNCRGLDGEEPWIYLADLQHNPTCNGCYKPFPLARPEWIRDFTAKFRQAKDRRRADRRSHSSRSHLGHGEAGTPEGAAAAAADAAASAPKLPESMYDNMDNAPSWAQRAQRSIPKRTRLGDSRRRHEYKFDEAAAAADPTSTLEGAIPPAVSCWLHGKHIPAESHYAVFSLMGKSKVQEIIAEVGEFPPPPPRDKRAAIAHSVMLNKRYETGTQQMQCWKDRAEEHKRRYLADAAGEDGGPSPAKVQNTAPTWLPGQRRTCRPACRP